MATKKQTRVPLSSFDDLDASGIGAGYTPYAMPVSETPAEAPQEGSGLIRRIAGDGILTAVKGAIGVPEAAVGLTDIATGGSVGKFLENEGGAVGFRPKQAKEYLDQFYSPEQKAAFAAVQGAANPEDGLGRRIVDTGMAALRNPSVVAHAVGESVPMIGAGGVLGRGVMAMAPKFSGFAAAGIGEGIMAAGSGAEQIRQQTDDGYLTGTQSMLAAGSGMATGALGIIAGKAAKTLGIGDIDTLIVGGKHVDPALQKGFTRKLLEGAFTEGVLEELPQSVQEQVVQNYALGKSLDEGVDQAVVMGLLSGGAMGMGAQVLGGSPKVPEVGPMSRAANLAGAPVVPPVVPAPVVAPVVPGVQPTAAEAAPTPAPFDAAAAQAEYRARTLAMEAQEEERARLDAATAPIPLEEASQEDQAAYLQGPATDEPSADDLFPAPAATVSGDILNTNGVPFKTLPGAIAAQKKAGDTHEVVPVASGFVVRAKEDTNGATATPAGLAQGADEPASNQPGGSGIVALAEPIDEQRGNVQGDAEPVAGNGPADAVPLPGTGPAAVEKPQNQPQDLEPLAQVATESVATAAPEIGTSANLTPAPVAEAPSEEGEQWTRMPQADRLALTTRTGMAKMVADKIARTPWADITPKTRARIVGAMTAPAPANEPAAPETTFTPSGAGDEGRQGLDLPEKWSISPMLGGKYMPMDYSSGSQKRPIRREFATREEAAKAVREYVSRKKPATPQLPTAAPAQRDDGFTPVGRRARENGEPRLLPNEIRGLKNSTIPEEWYAGWDEANAKASVSNTQVADAPELSASTRARNLLMQLQAKQDAEGMIGDDRLETQINQVKREIAKLDAAEGQNDELDAETRSYEAKANPTYSGEPASQIANVVQAAKDSGKLQIINVADKPVTPEVKAEPSANTVFTEDAYQAARARLKSKLGRLSSGLDPETMLDGITTAGYHIEKGARSFAAFAKAVVADLGDSVKPYLKSWYLGVRFDPRSAKFDGMDSAAVVESAELDAAEPAAEPEATENTAPDIVEHVTGKGKTLRGVVRTDLTQDQAKAIDKFTFKKDGGFFIREEHLDALNAAHPDGNDDGIASGNPTLETTEGRHVVAKLVADHLIGGNEFATIVEARKFIEKQTGTKVAPGTDAAKRADEAIELGVVIAARDIVGAARKQGRSDEVIFNRLVGIYKAQPSLNVRDSVSLRNQAYSTPVPLAFVASRLAKVTPQKQVGEPTAGNGALMMEANPKNATVNEIQDDRLEALRSQGFDPSQNNAATMEFAPKTLDAMVMNPPFGPLNGQKWTFGDFTTGEIDHAIVMNSLQALKDNGDAVMIIGGTLAQDDAERKSAYRGKAKREFFFTLYGQYNVVDHFTVSGDLYKKQGAAFPVDVLVIRGRGKSQRGLPAAQLPQMIGTWDELREKLNETSSVGTQGAGDTGRSDGANGAQPEQPVVPGVAALPSGGNGQRGGSVGPSASVGPAGGGWVVVQPTGPSGANGAADRTGQRTNAVTPAPAGDTGRVAPEGSNQQQGSTDGNRPDQPARVDAGSRDGIDKSAIADAADSGRLQVKYKNFSGNRSVNTLVSTNHLSAIENAFTNLRARVGDIDAFVRAELQYEPEQFKRSFSAEQVEALALAIDNIGQGKGFIIGDQTGIGKGRVVAAMIRYAKLNGKVPVFVTQMPDLYGDMMRDLNDIGMNNTRPLMTNNNASVPLDAEALEWFGEKQGINTRITELLDAIEGVVVADLGESAAGLEPEVRAKRIAEGIKTSTNPEIVSLRDEIKELKESMPARRGKFLDTPSIDAHEKALQKMVSEGSLGDHDVIFTTYNQMAALDSGKPKKNKETGVKTPASAPVYGYRSTFLNSFVNANAMLILDESHNAGEAGDGKFPKVGDVVRKLIGQSGGVFYSSATFAKNTAVMDVYSKTDLGSAFDTPGALVEAVNSVPMQQITSAMLVEAGQYLRRERSFDGIEYKTETVQVDQQAAEDVSTAMRLVVAFDKAKKSAIADMQDQLDQEGAVMSAVNGGGSMASVESVNFTSVMHNVVNTFLLSLKADAAASTAIAAIRAGEKPVITVANTMEMFITEFAKDAGLGIGDKLDATFADVLKRYLEKTRKASIKHANGNSEILVMTDAQLGPDAVDAYNEAYDFIDDMELDIPLSPIDHIKQKIEEAGFSIGEITGRQTVVTGGTLRNRNKAELNTAGKKNTIAKFNGGQIDALIINRSGSTGLSMHSSETFADQRRRLMIVAQAELDINNHMQMLGRTNRTGQVTENGKAPAGLEAMFGLPRYAQMTANVPIELRPAAVLSNKMAGLNANTTAGRKGSVQDQGALDFMNKYGDRVAAELVGGNSVLNERLGYPIKMDENGAPFVAGAMAKVTGRIGLLPLADQTDLYGQLATEYGELIAQLDALGQNDLEAKTYPLDAETLESKVVQKADARSKSPFTAAVTADKVSMRKLGKPYPQAKVLELVDAQLKGRDAMEVRRATLADVTAKINAEISALEDAKRNATPIESATIQKQVEVLNAAALRIRQTLPALGVSMMLKTEAGNLYGVVTKIERSGKAKSAGSLSAWKVQIAVVDGARSMTLPLTQLYVGDGAGVPDNGIVMSLANQMTIPNVARTGFDTVSVLEAFDRGQTEARETRVIITGNILRGYGALRGRLLNYTDNKGGIKQGILMPADFDMNAVQARFTPALKTEQQAIELLDKGGVVIDKGNSGETLRIQKAGGAYVISVAKTGLGKKLAKNAGDLNFVSSGNKMKVRVWDASEVREFLKNTVKPEGISLIPSADSMRLMESDPGTAFSRSTSDTTGQDKAQVTAIVRAIAERWGNAPKIVIADNMADPLIPQAVRDYDQTQKSQGATGEPEGFVYKGKVYLVADQLATPTDVMRVLFHESLGHMGLRGVFGDKLNPILQQLSGLRRSDVAAKAAQYGLDMTVEADRLQAAEEVLAELAQTKPELGYVKRAISLIRGWLRSNVPGFGSMKLTDSDIIAQFILPARRFIEGKGGPGGGRKAAEIGTSAKNSPSDARFSRSLGESLTTGMNAVRDVKLPAGYQVADLFEGAGRLSYWHKSVGTMYNLAQRSPAFKKVFDSIQSFLNDVSFYAAESADLAPNILPKLDKIGDVFKSPLSAADTKALSAPVFAGTLTWGRDKTGKAVPMEEIEASLAQVPLDDRAHMLVKGKKLDPKVLKMWQGLQQDQYEAMVNGKFEREFMKAGVVFTPAELKEHFAMTDAQVGLYQEFRMATDKSLDDLAISEMLNLAGNDADPIRAQILESASVEDAGQDLRDYLVSLVELEPGRDSVLSATAAKVLDIAAHAADLKGRGYAPLSRFGTFTLEATLETGERYFSMFETDRERNKVTRLLAQEGATDIKTGTMSQESYKLLNGVSPETAAIFGEMLGLESQGSEAKDLAFQEFIKRGTSNRSAMKRLLKRKGIAGFSDDAGRVLAGFIYSNARRTSSNLHAKETTSAVNDIPKEQGELKDTAVKLQEYVSNPQEEAQAFRGLLFAQYLGGSVASAMVNATQPFTVTFPYLSQFGGVRKAAAQMAQAVKDAAKNTTTGDARLDAALKKAEEDGIVSPQEVHALQAQASGNAQLRSGDGTLAGDGLAKAQNAMSKVSLAWGKVFGIAEQFNRRITFIAAYRTAVEQGMGNPPKFAEKAVAETQFVYNKGNKPRWARGVAGSILFTFKQYSVNYLELVARMATAGEPGSAERKAGQKAAILAIAVLFMMAGADGLPFVEDVQDVIDGTMQRMGYNFSSKQQMKEFFATQMGKDMAGFMMNGLSGVPGAPIDVSGRLGMGNLLPGTGVFLKKTDYTRDLTELAGPAGDLVKRAGTAFGQVTGGEVGAAMKTISPVAARNLAQGIDMQEKGMYLDSRGRKIIETTSGEALAKAVGFQPRNVKDVQEATMEVQRSKAQYNMATAEIRAKWAQAIFEGNEDLRQEARDDVATWNTNNPGQRIDVNMPAILARVREMRKGKAQRIADTAPKAIRAQVRQQLREELE